MKASYLYIAVAALICLVSNVDALELNYGGEYSRIPSQMTPADGVTSAPRAMHFRLRSQLYGTALTGNVRRSYREEKLQYANLLSAAYTHPFASESQRLHITADLRNTSDDYVQKNVVDLAGWMLDYSRGSAHRLQAGDISLYGSRYAFQRNVLGGVYQLDADLGGGQVSTQVGYGRLDEGVEGRRYERMLLASGTSWSRSLEQGWLQHLAVDLGYANTRDNAGSIDNDAGLAPLTNHVLGLGVGLLLQGNTRLRADMATSSLSNRRTPHGRRRG